MCEERKTERQKLHKSDVGEDLKSAKGGGNMIIYNIKIK